MGPSQPQKPPKKEAETRILITRGFDSVGGQQAMTQAENFLQFARWLSYNPAKNKNKIITTCIIANEEKSSSSLL